MELLINSMKQSPASIISIFGFFVLLLLLLAAAGTPVSADHDGTTGPHDDADKDGWTVEAGDCDDDDPDVNPGAREVTNGVDDDCDGRISTAELLYMLDVPGQGQARSNGTVKFFNASKGFGF
ncbi:MAG: hypothetical protein HOF43_11500 [Chloroflexi bacterium]|nr:hypothetical protein [Chloroflexota bacterium]MBT6680477.1 hypothetical protein [Chloroflexota bacterium]